MCQQEIDLINCEENGLNNVKKEGSKNRISIEYIPNRDYLNCNAQLSQDQKEKIYQISGKCKYQLKDELRYFQNITLYKYFNQNNVGDLNIEALAYQKLIDFIRDFNQYKDQNQEQRIQILLINKSQEIKSQNKYCETLNEYYPKIDALLKESSNDFKNDFFIRIAINLQDQIDLMLNGDGIFFFFFLNSRIDWSIQKTIQFLQRANQREIEAFYSQPIDGTNRFKIKKDTYRISLISIQKDRLDFEPLKKDNLQFLTFYFNKQNVNKQKNLNTRNYNYNIPIEDSLESLRVALQYFVKEKLKEFQPYLIIFYFQISNNLIKYPQVFYEFVKSFKKITQGKLIIIPQIDPQINTINMIQQYINCASHCFIGCTQKIQIQKLDVNKLIEYYEQLYFYFVETNNLQRKEFYKIQLKTLKIQKPNILEKQSKQNKNREFPLIGKDGNVVLLDIGQDFDLSQNQYFVEYNQNQIEEYNGFIVLIYSEIIFVIQFSEQIIDQNQSFRQFDHSKLYIVSKKQYPLPQNFDGVYFLDSELHILVYFFGFLANGKFCSRIQFLEILNYMAEWQIIECQEQKKQIENEFHNQSLVQLIKGRKQFSVSKNDIDGQGSQDKNSYVCFGGTYFNEECNYGCIIQEVVIAFNQKVYTTKIVEKSKIDKFYKECPNPLLFKINDSDVLYFEKNGIFNINNMNPCITKICFQNSKKYLIKNKQIHFKNSESLDRFFQFKQQLSSNQQNIRSFQIDKQVEDVKNFRVLVEDQKNIKQPIKNNDKIILRIFFVLSISFYSLNNEIHIDCKQFQVISHPFLKTIHELQEDQRLELFQNLVENLNNTFIFHYKEYDHQYILCYVDQTQKAIFRRFVFYDPKTQDKDEFRDYQEIIYQDWTLTKLYLIRKQITFTECNLRLYECHNINFQNVKESHEDILHQVPIQQIYVLSDFKSYYQLIGFHVEIKQNHYFEGRILTNKNWYIIFYQNQTIKHIENKYTKALNLNTQQKFVFIKFNQFYYLFYKNLQFQQVSVNEVFQNLIQIKYFFLDSNMQFMDGNTIQCLFNEPLSIRGTYDGLINNIKSQENRIQINILICQNKFILRSQILCQVNQTTNKFDLINVNKQTPLKHEGLEMFPLVQSNQNKGYFIVKQSNDHQEFFNE